jgi:ubiquinone biosynthesis protein
MAVASPSRRRQVAARSITSTIVALGPAAMKGAQIAATRRDVLPDWLCDALSTLWDQVPAPRRAGRDGLLRSLAGQDETVDIDLLGSGSIASVYRVRTSAGSDFAVKVTHPGIVRSVRLDLSCALIVARALQRMPMLRGTPVVEMVSHLCDGVWGQVDLRAEGRALVSLRESLATIEHIRVPRPDLSASTDELLVMEYVAPEPSGGLDNLESEVVAQQILQAVFQMLFCSGLVHVDLHPGNLSVRRSGVVIFDAGFVVEIPDKMRARFASFFLGLATGDGGRCATAVLESAVSFGAAFDRTAFADGIDQLVTRHSGRSAGDFSLLRFARELFDLQRKHSVFAEPGFIFPLLSLLAVEGRVKVLDPEADFQAVAVPFVLKAMVGRP